MHRIPAALCLVALSCALPDLEPAPDGAARSDAGVSDSGTADAATTSDAGARPRDASAGGDPDAGAAPRDAGRDTGMWPDAASMTRDAGAADDAGPAPATRPPVFGVTITDPWVAEGSGGAALRTALRALVGPSGRRPMARVVFDEGVDRVFRTYGSDASAYVDPVRAIGADARVMGELLDSFYMPDYSVAQLRARACEYRATLGHLVDVWEIGNEVNGEWLGARVLEKLSAVVEVFRADGPRFAALCPGFAIRGDERPFELALTLYENGPYAGGRATYENCWERADHAMLRWAAASFGPGGAGAAWRDALDYVWVSYYEDDCNDLQPDWQSIFDALGALFPRAALGIGECGTTLAARKRRYAERYYQGMTSSDPAFANMHVAHPRFVGGYFWWYFSQDLDEPAVTGPMHDALTSPFWSR